MARSLQSRLSTFARDVRGNIAVPFALSLTALCGAVGGGVDFSRSSSIGMELQAALDSGVLAAASLTQGRTPEDVVRPLFEAAIGDHPGVMQTLALEVTSESSLNARRVSARATVQSPTTLLGVLGINEITVMRQTEAVERARNIEISLVLDISSSMRGPKIDNLRQAALDFVDTVLDADVSGTTSISVIPYGGTVRLPDPFFSFVTQGETYSPPGFDWQLPVPRSAEDWNGCLEMNRTQVDRIALTPGGHGVLPDFTVWNTGNTWCPDEDGTEAVFLTNDRSRLHALLSRFDNPVLSDGTGTDIATSWGVRALDPAWRGRMGGEAEFSARPASYDDEGTMKVMVVMTDGGITQQYRPERGWDPETGPSHVGTRGADELYSTNEARRNFDNLCSYARDNGVVVYSIAFQVGGGRNRNDMEACATTPAQFYDVQDLNIASAFSSIAADLNQLRLSR